MRSTSTPHGGRLVSRVASPQEREHLVEKASDLRRIPLNSREVSDLELIAVGAFSPLEGFMGRKDYQGVVQNMRLSNGLPWTIPITLSITGEEGRALKEGVDLALTDEGGNLLALLHLEEKYPYDKGEEAGRVYGTTDSAHPGVAALDRQGELLLGGKITLLERIPHPYFQEYRLDPEDTRKLFAEKGWRTVVGFQTRNPVHCAHEYIQKCALEIVDGLLLHPLVGETKEDDVPADIRMRCYQILLDRYYPGDRVVLSVLPAAMRYAGPREAIFHALVRKNYGCSHFIVGRDHAGVGNYYGTYDAHRIFDEFDGGELGITPLFFDHTFYCRLCGNMASVKTCPHDPSEHLVFSGTKLRAMVQTGEIPPPECIRPEVAEILIEGMRKRLSKA